jgi:hypothetical protein
MVHTLQDYTTKYKLATIFSHIDEAELAARLGSIITFDRRGNVIWMDDFESGVAKWNLSGNGTGNTQLISTTRARNGSNSLALTCGSDLGVYSRMIKYLEPPVNSSIGFEFSFSIDANITKIEAIARFYDGTYNRYGYFKIDVTNAKIQYMNSAAGWVDLLVGISWITNTSYFYTIKMVCDFLNDTYLRVVLRDKTYDLSSVELRKVASATYPRFELEITAYGTAVTNAVAYIDDIIFTQNEI